MKKPIPWGRGIVTVLAIISLCIAIPFALQWRQMRAECADAEETVLAVLSDAFGTTGTVEAVFAPKYDFTCKEMLVLECDLPSRSRDDVWATVKGVRAQFAIIDHSGKILREAKLTDDRFLPFWTKPGTNSVQPAFLFHPVPPGEYRLRLTVNQPAMPLVGVPHRIIARYELCGIERLATVFMGGIALVSTVIGLSLTTGVILITRKKRRRARGGAGTSQ